MTNIADLHASEYENPPDIVVSAPASLKLLGEHTAASDGLILGFPVSLHVQVAVSVRKDNSVRFYSPDLDERKRTTFTNLKYKKEDRWANLPKAILENFYSLGVSPRGYNFTISGTIPHSVGLGSSASLLVAVIAAVNAQFGNLLAPETMFELLESVEDGLKANNVISPSAAGKADYLIALLGDTSSIMNIDCRQLSHKKIPLKTNDYRIILTDSKVPKLPIESELARRHEEIRKCVSFLSSRKPGKTLRDFDEDDLSDFLGKMPEVIRRRGSFVIDEIARTREAADLLKKGDIAAFGRIVNKAHASLRSLFEISCPEIDWLVKRATETEGVACSRMIGKGFGGCTYSLMTASAYEEYLPKLEEYERIFGFKPVVYTLDHADSVKILG